MDENMTELLDAIRDGNLSKIEDICTKNPDLINEPYNDNGWTPFMLICRNLHDPQSVKLGLDLGGDVDKRSAEGLTPFLIAARRSGDICVLDTLLYEGFADIDDMDSEGWNALMIAATHHWGMWKNGGVIEYLMDQGIDLEHKTNDGKTILDVVDNKETKDFIARYIKKKKYFDSIGQEIPMSHKDERWRSINYGKNRHDRKEAKKNTQKSGDDKDKMS